MTETKPQESYYGDDVIDLRELVKTLLKIQMDHSRCHPTGRPGSFSDGQLSA